MPSLGLGELDVIGTEVELVVMVFPTSAVFAPLGQDPEQGQILLGEQW